MSLKSQKIYICDSCETKLVIASEDEPKDWLTSTYVYVLGYPQRTVYFDMCKECANKIFPKDTYQIGTTELDANKRNNFWSWFFNPTPPKGE